jgi:uncharacterized protein (DUF111 family)
VVIRPHSGLSGDILVAGLALLAGAGQERLDDLVGRLGLESLAGRIRLEPRSLGGVAGTSLAVDLPPEHVHRTMRDVRLFFGRASISENAKALALGAFGLLAEAEGRVHGRAPDEIGFHEVGALDSLLDIGLAAALYDSMSPSRLVCGPLPICDGVIECAHGLLSSPAPAVAILLEGVAVRGLASEGETVTPTALALLKSLGAAFGPWPAMVVERQGLVYGTRVLPGVPNGALFVSGLEAPQSADPPPGRGPGVVPI